MITRDERNGFDLGRFEASEIAVRDQVVGVFVVALVRDVHADVVEQRRIFEPLALPIRKPMEATRLVEQRHGESRDLAGVLRPVVAALGELHDTAAADVGIPLGLRDLFAVSLDVIEDEPLSQREIAQREVFGAQAPEHRVEQHGSRRGKIGAVWIESGHRQPLLQRQRHELLPHTTERPRRHAPVTQRRVRRTTLFGRHHLAEAENRAGGADHALEPGARDPGEILARFRVDVFEQLARVARRERIAFHEPLGEADDPELEAAAKIDAGTRASRDLDAAAADIDDDRRVTRRPDGVERRQVDQTRFLDPRDHARTDAGPIDDRLEKRTAVLGFPRGAGGDGNDLVDPVRLGEAAELREHLQRRVHRLWGQRAAVESAGAQAHHLFLAVDDLEREVRTNAHDDHVQRVGPDVDGGKAHACYRSDAAATGERRIIRYN